MTVPNVPPVGQPGAQQPVNTPGQQPTSSSQFPAGAPSPFGSNVDLNATIQPGPGVPAMFVGKRVGEVLNISSQLIRQRAQQPQPQQPVPPATQSIQAVAQQVAQQQGGQVDPAVIAEAVRMAIQQETLPDRILRVRSEFSQRYQQFASYAQEVEQVVSELPIEQQAQPAMWDYALRMVIGQKAIEGQLQQPARAPQPNANGFNQQQVNLPPNAWAPSGQQMFTEQPNGNGQGLYQQGSGQTRQLTQEQLQVAQKLGVDPQRLQQFNTEYFGGNY